MSMTATQNLLVELFVEELPPKALKKLGEAFGGALQQGLRAQGLADEHSAAQRRSPRRAGWPHASAMCGRVAADKAVSPKLMPVAVGLDAAGQPTPALLKKLAGAGRRCQRAAAAAARSPTARPRRCSSTAWRRARRWPPACSRRWTTRSRSCRSRRSCSTSWKRRGADFQPGWTSVNFVRPAHGLVALHGADVVPVPALGLQAGRQTRGHRFEASVDPGGAAARRPLRAPARGPGRGHRQLRGAPRRDRAPARRRGSARSSLKPIDDDALLDEVTALVERPNVLLCRFEAEFLAVPPECLILTMKANQKYFPLLDADGQA